MSSGHPTVGDNNEKKSCARNIELIKAGPNNYFEGILNKTTFKWFADEDFVPLGIDLRSLADVKDARLWMPPAQVLDTGAQLYTQVYQGYSDTCYVLAALSSISLNRRVFHRILLNKETSQSGYYIVRLWIRGKPWLINVDDRVAFYPGTQSTVHARISQYGTYWPLIVEKAWAKIKGGYKEAGFGFASNALRALTGLPVFDHFTKQMKADDVWQEL